MVIPTKDKMSNDDMYRTVPLFDGSNYTVWAQDMTAALRAKGVWQVARGSEVRPPDLPSSASAAEIAARVKQQSEWDNRDDQALGSMKLKMPKTRYYHTIDTRISSD